MFKFLAQTRLKTCVHTHAPQVSVKCLPISELRDSTVGSCCLSYVPFGELLVCQVATFLHVIGITAGTADYSYMKVIIKE